MKNKQTYMLMKLKMQVKNTLYEIIMKHIVIR